MRLFGNSAAWQRQERLRPDARRAIHRAEIASAARGLSSAPPDALLLALLEDEDDALRRLLSAGGIDVAGLHEALIGAVPVRPHAIEGSVPLDDAAREAVVLGLNEARRMGLEQAGAGHVILGILEAGSGAGARYLRRSHADLNRLRALVVEAEQEDEGADAAPFQEGLARLLATVGGGRRCGHCGAQLHESFGYCYACGAWVARPGD
jgi:ATP-dependent Clp protease ATP-binding subunit ClpA